jgi:hypothetical protein
MLKLDANITLKKSYARTFSLSKSLQKFPGILTRSGDFKTNLARDFTDIFSDFYRTIGFQGFQFFGRTSGFLKDILGSLGNGRRIFGAIHFLNSPGFHACLTCERMQQTKSSKFASPNLSGAWPKFVAYILLKTFPKDNNIPFNMVS